MVHDLALGHKEIATLVWTAAQKLSDEGNHDLARSLVRQADPHFMAPVETLIVERKLQKGLVLTAQELNHLSNNEERGRVESVRHQAYAVLGHVLAGNPIDTHVTEFDALVSVVPPAGDVTTFKIMVRLCEGKVQEARKLMGVAAKNSGDERALRAYVIPSLVVALKNVYSFRS